MQVLKKMAIIVFIFITSLFFSGSFAIASSDELAMVYGNSIIEHLNNNWDYLVTPDKLQDSTIIKIKIDRGGNVLEKSVFQPALSKALEEEALRQLADMEPFPKMPENLNKGAAAIEFTYQFVPTGIGISLEEGTEFLKSKEMADPKE